VEGWLRRLDLSVDVAVHLVMGGAVRLDMIMAGFLVRRSEAPLKPAPENRSAPRFVRHFGSAQADP